MHAARRGPWRERPGGEREVHHPNPAKEVQAARQALRTFLRDEFTSLDPMICHLLVLTSPGARLAGSGETDPPVVSLDTAAQAIISTALPLDRSPLDLEPLELLSTALCDRGLTASQRAEEPFVFRSGGIFGSDKKVWTIRAAGRHMDRHPEDGVFHLRNGTLAQRLSEHGDIYLSPVVARSITTDFLALHDGLQPPGAARDLTPREREVLQLVAEGHTSRAIAHMLHISQKTVQKHRASVMSKLGVNNIAALIQTAINQRLVFFDR